MSTLARLRNGARVSPPAAMLARQRDWIFHSGWAMGVVLRVRTPALRITFAACLCVWPLCAQSATPTINSTIGDREKAGVEVARKARTLMTPQENSKVSGVLTIRDREGKETRIPVSSQVLAGGAQWQISYEAKLGASSEKLTIVHSPDGANEYLYSKAGGGQPQKLSGAQAMIPFAGSDFWLTDLGLEFLSWPRQFLAKTEMRRSRWCDVLISTNPSPAAGAYARVESFLDRETGGPILAHAYDAKGARVKEFSIRSLTKVQGEYKLEGMEIRSDPHKSRTRIEFELEPK